MAFASRPCPFRNLQPPEAPGRKLLPTGTPAPPPEIRGRLLQHYVGCGGGLPRAGRLTETNSPTHRTQKL